MEQNGGGMKGSVTSARYKPNPRRQKHVGDRTVEGVGCSHGDALCQSYPFLKRRVIVLLVKLIEGGQLIG